MTKVYFEADWGMQVELEKLRAAQEPLRPGMPCHPSRKAKFMNALAKAFEEGRIVAVKKAEQTP